MNIKNFLIKKLGGYTEKEYNNKYYIPIEVNTNSYYIDEDSLEFEKEQLAYKLGKELLDNDLIQFEILQKRDSLFAKIYIICARIFIGEKLFDFYLKF